MLTYAARIKEMLVKNLMLQITPAQIGDDLPLFGPNGLGLDSIDALELWSAWKDLWRGGAQLRGGRKPPSGRVIRSTIISSKNAGKSVTLAKRSINRA